jgi:hypothetical protein
MGISQAEREMLSKRPRRERRKGERRKDTETARHWKGMERRVFERRSLEVSDLFKKP